jgi:hypothetical protein
MFCLFYGYDNRVCIATFLEKTVFHTFNFLVVFSCWRTFSVKLTVMDE